MWPFLEKQGFHMGQLCQSISLSPFSLKVKYLVSLDVEFYNLQLLIGAKNQFEMLKVIYVTIFGKNTLSTR